jgi:hypothetical protein
MPRRRRSLSFDHELARSERTNANEVTPRIADAHVVITIEVRLTADASLRRPA